MRAVKGDVIMKKLLTIIAITLIAAGMIALTSCKPSSFGMTGESEKLIMVEAENADKDSSSTLGGLEVAEGEQIEITSSLESGSVRIEIFEGTEEQSADEITEPEADPVMTFEASGYDGESATFEAGYYFARATVTEKASGSVSIEVLPAEGEQWNTAESTDDAGEKAGVELFLVDPSGLSLGPVTDADYRYKEGIAEAHYGIAAVDLYVRKGLASIDEGDISFDQNDYKYEWTKEIDGAEVKCCGNREGEATKTIWTKGDHSYAVLAYGAGGDDDFGLSDEDLTTLLADIQ